MTIQALLKEDISRLAPLQPAGWNDIRLVLQIFFNLPCFYAVKMEKEDQIIAIGEAIINEDSAWIGNIIVLPPFRNRGYGKKITVHLMNYIKGLGIPSQFILATEIGRPMYQSLGFSDISQYIFFKRTPEIPETKVQTDHVIPYHPRYDDQIYAMDQKAMGENRQVVLKHFLDGGSLFIKNGQLAGFYLKELGDGLIIVSDHEAGLTLSRLRLFEGRQIITLPEQNLKMIQWATQRGFKPYRKAYKMVLGEINDWKPEMVYSRIGGYLG